MTGMGFLQDTAGNNSSSRLLILIALAAILVVWSAVSIRTNTMAALPESIVGLLAILVGNKLGTGYISERKPTPPNGP